MTSSPAMPQTAAAAPSRAAGLAVPGFFAVLVIGFAAAGSRMLADPDTHWHVAIGRAIRETGALPWVDRWSHTFAGEPWIAKEWLSQVVLSAVRDISGDAGLVLAASALVAATFAGLFGWLARRLPPATALIFVLVALILSLSHIIVRPHLLTLPLLMLWTGLLLRAAEEGRAPSLWLVPVMALWANLHAGWPAAFLVAAGLGAEAVLRAPPERRRRVLLAGAGVGLLTGLAVFATPYGIAPLRIGAALLGGGEPLPFILEWQPLEADMLGLLAAVVATGAVVLLAGEGWRGLPRLLMVLALAVLAARYSRFLTLFAIVTVMACASPLAHRLRQVRAPVPAPGRAGLALAFTGALLAAAIVAVRPPAPSPGVTPVAALAAARSAGLSGPVLNSYEFGGYLIAQGVPTFIDGRTDQLFLGGFMGGLYAALIAGDSAAFRTLLDRHGVTWALVHATLPEAPLLRELGWREIHRDDTASVFVRP